MPSIVIVSVSVLRNFTGWSLVDIILTCGCIQFGDRFNRLNSSIFSDNVSTTLELGSNIKPDSNVSKKKIGTIVNIQ